MLPLSNLLDYGCHKYLPISVSIMGCQPLLTKSGGDLRSTTLVKFLGHNRLTGRVTDKESDSRPKSVST